MPTSRLDWARDLTIKINELREITDWEKPIYVKVGATRTYYDVKLAVHAGADVVVVDGMQGGTAATQEVFIEHVGVPTLAAVPQAVQALAGFGVHRDGVQLIVSGGIRNGADVDQGAGAGRRRGRHRHRGVDRAGRQRPSATPRSTNSSVPLPASTTTSKTDATPQVSPLRIPSSRRASTRVEGGRRLANFLRVMTLEAQTIARACGKAHVRHLEPEDLVALTIEAAAMARVPLAGTDWVPGQRGGF